MVPPHAGGPFDVLVRTHQAFPAVLPPAGHAVSASWWLNRHRACRAVVFVPGSKAAPEPGAQVA